MDLKRIRPGFSLIELLLVVAIMGVLTALTLPSFVKSIRGNKLRTAGRAVVVAGRYARSMALLKQQELALVFDMTASTIAVYPASEVFVNAESNDPDGNSVRFTASLTNDPLSLSSTNPVGSDVSAAPAGAAELKQKMEDVRYDYIQVGEGTRQVKGTCMILYKSNGTCSPYEVKVVDDRGVSITIKVDALSSAKTEGGSE